jgi:tetratricopeptide (TPR) repeat protein
MRPDRSVRHGSVNVVAAVAIPLLFGGVVLVSRLTEATVASLQPGADVLNLSSPRMIKKMSLGYDSLMADIYWTRVVQYYGDKRHAQGDGASGDSGHFPLLMPLLDITTTLDPQLLVAYKAGAIFLAEPAPRGAQRPDLAVKLLRQGIANNPDNWRLWHDLGMVYYEDLRDYKAASDAYYQGSKNPKADEWMKVMAAKIAQDGRSPETSRFLWTEIYNSTKDLLIRNNAAQHLKQLEQQ